MPGLAVHNFAGVHSRYRGAPVAELFLSPDSGSGENPAEYAFVKLSVNEVWVGKLVELNAAPVLIF